jgi:hypothetical protein
MKCGYWIWNLDSLGEFGGILTKWQITTTALAEIGPSRYASYVRGEGVQMCKSGGQPSMRC